MSEKNETLSFNGLGIAEKLLETLHKLGISEPTPIQFKSIPVACEGKDIIGVAQTGTGKTLAFSIPMIQRLALYKGKGLVLLPTRELALQVDESMRAFGASIGLRTAVLIGGESINRQREMLRRNPHVLIATPGRMNDFIQRGWINLSDVKILVL
ncbi:MAG TPA: DEAD/DEAH box helicase, partial [Candidatus Nanoarchaeia archaeon]|nr:DEAD/DEAH box helicase [Candidatus Nanoarchaeia archaeon]